MASTFNVAIGAAVAMLWWTALGYVVTRRLVPPPLALPMAPTIGWAIHGSIALLVFLAMLFSAVTVATVAVLVLLGAFTASHFSLRLSEILLSWPGLSRPSASSPGKKGVDGRDEPGHDDEPASERYAHSVPLWTYGAAALLAVAPAAAVLPKWTGDGVSLDYRIFDHAKVALVDDLMKFGLPAGNPFFSEPHLAYYYLWHFSAAELATATGISGWEADAAMTWFAAAASLAMMMGLAAWLGGRSAAILAVLLSASASARTVLEWIFGANRIDAVIEPAEGFAGWLFQAAWVPQHIMSASCVVAAAVLMSRLAQVRGILATTVLALLVAAAFESSTWIGGVAFAAAAPVIALALALRGGGRMRFFAALAVAALLAALFVTPLLREQLMMAAARSSGAPITLQFYPVLTDQIPAMLWAWLNPPAFWLVLLPIELPAIYVTGVVALAWFWRAPGLAPSTRDLAAALAALSIACLVVSWLLASTLGGNNDLGWRALLPAVMALTAFAAAGIARAFAARAYVAAAAALGAALLGAPFAIDLIRDNLLGEPRAADRQFAASADLWAAVRRHAAADERVADNPLFLHDMTVWPVNISWALLANRRSCYAGRELVLVYSSLSAAARETIDAQFIRVFAGRPAPGDVDGLATTYDCRVIVLTPRDGAWRSDPFAASPRYRLVEEVPDRWRIYRAKDSR
jgi:hypothetical protein